MADGVAVTASGTGRVLFCLHGLLGSGRQFSALSGLTDHYRVAAWDAPGYGGSAAPAAGADLQWYVEQAAAAIASEAGSEPVHLLGTGWGGIVAMALATAHPERVRSVVVADSAPGGALPAPGTADELRGSSPADFAAGYVARSVAPGCAGSAADAITAELAEGPSADGYAAAAASAAGTDLSPRLRRLLMPCMVVAGEDSGTAALQRSQDISTAIPEAVFVTMYGAGALTHLERPDVFTAWVRSFLYIVDKVREDALP